MTSSVNTLIEKVQEDLDAVFHLLYGLYLLIGLGLVVSIKPWESNAAKSTGSAACACTCPTAPATPTPGELP